SVLLLVVGQVLLRYVFKAPLMGIEELLFFPTIWLYMLGGANASQERNHISCGILTLYIKKPLTMMKFNIMKNTVSIIVGVWLLYWAYWLFTYSLNLWKTSDLLYIPMFFMESAPFIGLLLMVFYGVIEWLDSIQIYLRERRK
ncbi:MAG: TRAP transporter small permease subunit, partial [Gudongella sp.]|nr:TRAP transporter small permease subunit [Gudongella sp.]